MKLRKRRGGVNWTVKAQQYKNNIEREREQSISNGTTRTSYGTTRDPPLLQNTFMSLAKGGILSKKFNPQNNRHDVMNKHN